MNNLISFSAVPLIRIINKDYYDLEGILEAMRKLWNCSAVNGFEFQLLAEWNPIHPPKDYDPTRNRVDAWNSSKKFNCDQIIKALRAVEMPLLSVHANRDVGSLLCSENSNEVNEGKNLISETIQISRKVKSKICVFHLWDTWKTDVDIFFLKKLIGAFQKDNQDIKLTVENMPTKMDQKTPFELIKNFKWITFDLRWAAMYNELNKFEVLKNKIVNIHIRGQLEDQEWILKNSPFSLHEALNIIISKWKYKGILTFEPEGGLLNAPLENLVSAINSIKKSF